MNLMEIMDCDFYTFYCINIEYKKGDTIELKQHILKDTIEEHFWYDCVRWGGEAINDYYDRKCLKRYDQVEYELDEYKREDIYKNNTWLCNNTYKDKYGNLLKGYGISQESLIKIWKCGDYTVV